MAIPDVLQTGRSGLIASKVGISVSGHNITNAETEGYSRQRVIHSIADPKGLSYEKNRLGTGTRVARVERINDAYLEKQLRSIQKEFSYCEEKDLALRQVEDIFNELNDDGLNRLISHFFNEFRKLANEPENAAIRQSVREASQAMVNDFHRLRRELEDVRSHLDNKVDGVVLDCNATLSQIANLNYQIKDIENQREGSPNDLLDRRDALVKKLSTFVDFSVHPDEGGVWNLDLKGAGPLVAHFEAAFFSTNRTPADEEGKADNTFDVRLSHHQGPLTHLIQGGKLGALLEVRDKTLSVALNRLDELAFQLVDAVNQVHQQGFSLDGHTGLNFFEPFSISQPHRAAERIRLSREVQSHVNSIAAALEPQAPGDNRVAIAISQLQFDPIMNQGYSTADEWYNSIVSDVGVASSRNRFALIQQEDVMTQLDQVKEQISGVSIDEETIKLLEYQHLFDASSKVIQIADEMLKTVLSLKK